MQERSSRRTGGRYLWALLAGAMALGTAPPAAAQIVSSFDGLTELVSDFQVGLAPDVVNAQCTTPNIGEVIPGVRPFEPVDQLACTEGNTPVVGSGWDIMRACFVAFENGTLVVGFLQSGLAGDGDGDGDPNGGGFQFDVAGIGSAEAYDVTLDSDFVGMPEFQVSITDVDVGTHDTPDRGDPAGALCLVREPGLASPPVGGPDSTALGCRNPSAPRLGTYRAGTTGTLQSGGGAQASKEVLIEVFDIANLPSARPLDPRRLRITLQAGSKEVGETCGEDFTTFLALGSSITLDKTAEGDCRNENFRFEARYEVRNDGLTDFDAVELTDTPATVPAGLLTGRPTCTLDGSPLSVDDLGNGAFRAQLGPLPASDFDAVEGDVFPSLSDIDCGGDFSKDPSCGLAVVRCAWDPIPIDDIDQVEFDNQADVDGLVGGISRATGDASASAMAVRTPACVPPNGGNGGTMIKEHEGVGFDDRLGEEGFELTQSIPFGNDFAFGSNVDPDGGPDVDVREDFTAQGSLEVIGRPGVFANLPRIPPGKGLRAQNGSRAVFTWTILVTEDPIDSGPNLDVTCSLCSQKPWRTDGAPAQTFVPDPMEGNAKDLTVANQAVMLTVRHVCGPTHGGGGQCGGALDAVTIPGLMPRSSDVLGQNFVTFIGCKPTTVRFDHQSSGDPILIDDLLEVRLTVPETERSQIFADVTSCEASYLATPRP